MTNTSSMNTKNINLLFFFAFVLLGLSTCKETVSDPVSRSAYFINNQSSQDLIYIDGTSRVDIPRGFAVEIKSIEALGETGLGPEGGFNEDPSNTTQNNLYRDSSGIDVEIVQQLSNPNFMWVEAAQGPINGVNTFFYTLVVTDDLFLEYMITATDADGNVYNSIKIGDQYWMIENLKTTTFNDGTPITEYTSDEEWNKDNKTFPFYQWASTEDLNNAVEEELPFDYYGAMYNHAAIESGKLAPQGWRIPTEQDWIELRDYLSNDGHLNNEANALKSFSGWVASSGNGFDAYGFKGLPNGYVDSNGTPKVDGIICTWATSDYTAADETRRIINLFDESLILFFDQSVLLGCGIRCVKE